MGVSFYRIEFAGRGEKISIWNILLCTGSKQAVIKLSPFVKLVEKCGSVPVHLKHEFLTCAEE